MPGNRNSGRRTANELARRREKQAEWRESIEVTKILKRLSNHVLRGMKMDSSQIRAAEVLLRKALPDLTAADIQGDVAHNYVAFMPTLVEDAEEWHRQNMSLMKH